MFSGPGFKCYVGIDANSEVVNCNDIESGTKYCMTTINDNGTVLTRACGLPSVIADIKARNFWPIPGCKTRNELETCVCTGEKCN